MNDSDQSPAGPRRKRLRTSQRHEKENQQPPRRTRLVSHAPTSHEGLERFKELLEAAMDGRGASEEFLSLSSAMYKNWKRSGAVYDEFCFACQKAPLLLTTGQQRAGIATYAW
uniref:Uncharacterized protein n=1 Tax=Bionectria ochroleuca TaxID=29856 RepID=A0A0B7KGW8_BIOOC